MRLGDVGGVGAGARAREREAPPLRKVERGTRQRGRPCDRRAANQLFSFVVPRQAPFQSVCTRKLRGRLAAGRARRSRARGDYARSIAIEETPTCQR